MFLPKKKIVWVWSWSRILFLLPFLAPAHQKFKQAINPNEPWSNIISRDLVGFEGRVVNRMITALNEIIGRLLRLISVAYPLQKLKKKKILVTSRPRRNDSNDNEFYVILGKRSVGVHACDCVVLTTTRIALLRQPARTINTDYKLPSFMGARNLLKY